MQRPRKLGPNPYRNPKQKENKFSDRVYIYSTRLFDKFRRPVASFAVLGDGDRSWRPQLFQQKALGSRHDFSFQIAKLLDYEEDELLKISNNPFSIIVQAHLAAQATKSRTRQQNRRQQKYNLTIMLYERGWSKQEIIDLYRFIDWVLTLPPELEESFRQDITNYEREKNMPYISTIERMGKAEGKIEGRVDLIALLLAQQLGTLSGETIEDLKKVPIEQLDQLALNLRDFTNIDALATWIGQNKVAKT